MRWPIWRRRVPWQVIGVFTVGYAATMLMGPGWPDPPEVVTPTAVIRWLLLSMGSLGLGHIRFSWSHPLADARYARWLATTPWQDGQPLPWGRPHVDLWDAVVVGVITLLCLLTAPLMIGWPWTTLAAVYLVLCSLLYMTGWSIGFGVAYIGNGHRFTYLKVVGFV